MNNTSESSPARLALGHVVFTHLHHKISAVREMSRGFCIQVCVGASLVGLLMGGSVESAPKRQAAKADSELVKITPKTSLKGTGIRQTSFALKRAPRSDVRQPRPLSAPIPHLGERADHCVTLTGIEAVEETQVTTEVPTTPVKPTATAPEAATPTVRAEGVSGSLWSMGEWKPAS